MTAAVFAGVLASIAGAALAGGSSPPATTDLGVEQRIGARLPLDVQLTDWRGRRVRLGDLFGERPVILTPVYYRCPSLCGLVLSGVLEALNTLEMRAGEDFDVVTVSVDPSESPELAAGKRASTMSRYRRQSRSEQDPGWHFLVGEPEPLRELFDAAGFRFVRDDASGQYAHAAAIAVATPDGRISRYLFGVEYSARDLRLALVEASGGRLGNIIDSALLYCLQYDPSQGRYSVAVLASVKAGGVLVSALLVGAVALSLVRERTARRRRAR